MQTLTFTHAHRPERCQPCTAIHGEIDAPPACFFYTGPLGTRRAVCWHHYFEYYPDAGYNPDDLTTNEDYFPPNA